MPSENEEKAPKAPRRISQKQIKIIVVVVVIIVVVGVLVWGMIPEKIYELAEVLDDQDKFEDDYISVKGVVTEWNKSSDSFTLTDSNDETLTILVIHDGPFPEGFGINVTAVVKGTFKIASGNPIMESNEIQIGCPSKY